MMEDYILITCKTTLDNHSIKALARYHFSHKKDVKRKRIITFSFGIILLLLSIINAYGYWLKYYGTESVLTILLRSSVLFLLSFIILYTGLKGSEHNLYRELKQYFAKTKTNHIDYTITEEGINIIINDTCTLCKWESINQIESDADYYYFSSNGKHSIISKKNIPNKTLLMIDTLIKDKIHS